MKLAIGFLILSLLSGCAGLDAAMSSRGKIYNKTSKMDNTQTVYMTPAMTNHGGVYPEFGLYWADKFKDKALLIVQINKAETFNRKKNLTLMIDGEKFSLRPASKRDFGDINYDSVVARNKTTKDYVITKSQILKIANGKSGSYRLYLHRSYIEGDINYGYKGYQSYLPKPFLGFYAAVWGG